MKKKRNLVIGLVTLLAISIGINIYLVYRDAKAVAKLELSINQRVIAVSYDAGLIKGGNIPSYNNRLEIDMLLDEVEQYREIKSRKQNERLDNIQQIAGLYKILYGEYRYFGRNDALDHLNNELLKYFELFQPTSEEIKEAHANGKDYPYHFEQHLKELNQKITEEGSAEDPYEVGYHVTTLSGLYWYINTDPGLRQGLLNEGYEPIDLGEYDGLQY